MAKKRNGGTGLLLVAAGLGAFAVLRQGQASANTLTSATLKGFELKGLKGTSLAAVANVEFSNTEVNRDTALQALGMNVMYNDTVISTVHLTEPQTLPANQNVTVGVPMTLNLGSLFTQLALTGKIPSLASFRSLPALRTWLQDKIAPESLQLQGTAKVDGLAVRFNNPLNLADYLPSAPRTGPVAQLPSAPTRPTVRGGVPSSIAPASSLPRVVQSTPVATKAAPTARKTGRTATIVRQGAAIVRQAASAVRSVKKSHPATGGRPTAGKVRKAAKPPRSNSGLPEVNLPVVKR